MRRKESKASDLFLLMLNLTQITSKEKVIAIFIDAFREIWPEATAAFQSSGSGGENNLMDVSASGKHYGYIRIDPSAALKDEDQALLQNACGMLAVILKNIEHEALLADAQRHLTKLVSERTRHLEREIEAHQRTEEALLLANERLQRFVNANIVGIVIADASGVIFEANDYYLRMIDYTREELEQGKVDWRAITPPEWLHADEQALRELQEQGTCTPYEKEYIRRDGTRVPAFLADALLPGPKHEIAAFVLDISDRKRAEEEIIKLNQKLEQKVNERTSELKKAIAELEELNRVFVGRELKMAELKARIAELEKLSS